MTLKRILFLSVIIFFSCNTTDRKFNLEMSKNHWNKVTIQNESNKNVDFELSMPNNFLINKTKVVDSIKIISKTRNIELHIAAWLFVVENTAHAFPKSSNNWIHDPLIFMNSIGEGWCDDRASVLSKIWEWLGFETRIWVLNGHVVPEVNVNDEWFLLDPDLEVYYLNDDNVISNVLELSNNSSLITNPTVVPSLVDTSIVDGYLEYKHHPAFANLYASKNDNEISSWFTNYSKELNVQYFSIPANSSIAFPIIYEYDYREIRNRGCALKVTVFKSENSNTLKIPLVIESIKGQGNIRINNQSYNLESFNTSFIDSIIAYNSAVELECTSDSVEIFYSLNPHLFMNKALSSELTLKGKSIDDLNTSYTLNKNFETIHDLDSCRVNMRKIRLQIQQPIDDQYIKELYTEFLNQVYDCYSESTIRRQNKIDFFIEQLIKFEGKDALKDVSTIDPETLTYLFLDIYYAPNHDITNLIKNLLEYINGDILQEHYIYLGRDIKWN